MTDGSLVLVVDDEPNITELLAMAFRYEGFRVERAGNGRDAVSAAETLRPALIVLDVMLPDIDGFQVARRLRDAGSKVPIIFLTAKDATADKVEGLGLGGDDYVTKPFSLDELIARARAIMRRAGDIQGESRLTFADLVMDDDTREVWRGDERIDLTDTEYRLLRYLMSNPRRALTRQQILQSVWDYDFGGDARVLETYVSYLRKKVDAEGPPLIHTIRGVGYSLRLPDETR